MKPFSLELRYQDIEGATYHSSHTLNLAEFEGRNANEPTDIKMWRELEKIRKILAKQ